MKAHVQCESASPPDLTITASRSAVRALRHTAIGRARVRAHVLVLSMR
jgi:hypothetical protein